MASVERVNGGVGVGQGVEPFGGNGRRLDGDAEQVQNVADPRLGGGDAISGARLKANRCKACCLFNCQPSMKKAIFVTLVVAAALLLSYFVGGVHTPWKLGAIGAGAFLGSLAFTHAVRKCCPGTSAKCCMPTNGYYNEQGRQNAQLERQEAYHNLEDND